MNAKMPQTPDPHLSGEQIFGDDFRQDQIAAWYKDEEEGYAELAAREQVLHTYEYHAQNRQLGYRHLGKVRFEHVLGFGSGFGLELLPIADRIDRVSLLDASSVYVSSPLPVPNVRHFKATESGILPFEDGSFDLITCFGVLHHIPNVSFVLGEFARTSRAGGMLLVREPTTSMGDWSHPRPGLTKRERGLPVSAFSSVIMRAGFDVVDYSPCFFPLVPLLWRVVGTTCYNSGLASRADILLSRLFAWNYRYHRVRSWQKFAPAGGYWVLRRQAGPSPRPR